MKHQLKFKSNGQISCGNCSEYGEPKPKGTRMILEDGSFFCLHCYRILERLVN